MKNSLSDGSEFCFFEGDIFKSVIIFAEVTLDVDNCVIMGKKYHAISDNQRTLKDPAVACITNDGLHALVGDEGLLTGTMSVDAYFDELIEQVRQDYEAI